MPLRHCGAPGWPHRRSVPVPLPHLRTRRPTSARAPSAARATTRSPAGWTTRGPRRLTKPTRFSRPNASAAQQTQILRRLETLERPGRVLAFPRFRHSGTSVRRGPQRWIAAAAVAGLIVGVGAGELLDFRRSMSGASAGHLGSQPLPLGQSARGTLQPVAFSSEDLFLYDDSDAASTSPSVEALQALDALTPRVRDLDQAR